MREIITRSLPAALIMFFGLAVLAGHGLADEKIGGDDFAALSVIDVEVLDELRGREGDQATVMMNLQDLEATVHGSLIDANSIVSGAVTIREQALDFHGVGLFNIVTGSNNAVNGAIGVTFNLH